MRIHRARLTTEELIPPFPTVALCQKLWPVLSTVLVRWARRRTAIRVQALLLRGGKRGPRTRAQGCGRTSLLN